MATFDVGALFDEMGMGKLIFFLKDFVLAGAKVPVGLYQYPFISGSFLIMLPTFALRYPLKLETYTTC